MNVCNGVRYFEWVRLCGHTGWVQYLCGHTGWVQHLCGHTDWVQHLCGHTGWVQHLQRGRTKVKPSFV